MCILIAKPKGIKMPDMKTLENCWDSNPDGAGLAWSDGRKIYLKKGYMKWEAFRDDVVNLAIDDYNAIIHFRIATHGTVKPDNTHPFSVNESIVAGHNGVLNGVTNEGDWTDSETFFKRICAPILKSFDLTSEVFRKCVEAMIGTSKLAFLSEKGEMLLFGNFINDGGVYYSNSTYKESRYETCGYGYYGGYYAGYGKYNDIKNACKPYVKKAFLTEEEQEHIIWDLAVKNKWQDKMYNEDDITKVRMDFIELMNKYDVSWYKMKETAAKYFNTHGRFTQAAAMAGITDGDREGVKLLDESY